ncbi:hypothetical protein HYW41_04805 [Candidatus Daviesbacteria bacterium]|nr:hypothetical protein [Candidatus Daviesbacteria bacterium]
MSIETPEKYLLNLLGSETKREGTSLPPPTFHDLLLTEQILPGGLNVNWVYSCSAKSLVDKFVLRVSKAEDERIQMVRSIQFEYDSIGASAIGVGFRLRTIEEQTEFTDLLCRNGFNALQYIAATTEAMLLPFISGIQLNQHIKDSSDPGSFEVVKDILLHLNSVHKQNITIGDRWCPNTIILPDNRFIEIDFDIELTGDVESTMTFELSQLLYHIVHFADRNRVMAVRNLAGFLHSHPRYLEIYDLVKLKLLLIGHTNFFASKNEAYEGIDPPNSEMYDLIEEIKPYS